MPHRSVILAPFALLFLVTLVGGQVNRVDADGIVVDTSTSLPVPGVSVTYGKSFPKGSVTDEQGHYFIPNLPRDANLGTRMAGYQPASAPATAAKIEVTPGTLTRHHADQARGRGLPGVAEPLAGAVPVAITVELAVRLTVGGSHRVPVADRVPIGPA